MPYLLKKIATEKKSYLQEIKNSPSFASQVATAENHTFDLLFDEQKLGYELLDEKRFLDVYNIKPQQLLNILVPKYEDEIVDTMLDSLNLNYNEFDVNLDFEIAEHFRTSTTLKSEEPLFNRYIGEWSEKRAHEDAYILSNSDIAIGEEFNLGLTCAYIDIFNRTGTFVYLKDKIEYSNDNLSHSQLLNKLLDKNVFEYVRPDADNIYEQYGLDDSTPLAFGHMVDNIAFIDDCFNIDKFVVAKEVLSETNAEKVFSIPEHCKTTRLASKI